MYWYACGPLCDSNKQLGWNYVKAGWCLVGEWFLYESSSNCISQMGASNTPELPSDGYTVQAQSVND